MKTNFWIKKFNYKYFQKQLYRLNGITKRNYININRPGFMLKALTPIFLKADCLEAGRRLIRHFFKKFVKIEIFIRCNKSITQKSNGTRMGKGKGNLKEWIFPLMRGVNLMYTYNLNIFQNRFILLKVQKKFGLSTKIVSNCLLKHTFLKNNIYY